MKTDVIVSAASFVSSMLFSKLITRGCSTDGVTETVCGLRYSSTRAKNGRPLLESISILRNQNSTLLSSIKVLEDRAILITWHTL